MDNDSPESIFEAHRENAKRLFESRGTPVNNSGTSDNIPAPSDGSGYSVPPTPVPTPDTDTRTDINTGTSSAAGDAFPGTTSNPVTLQAAPAVSPSMFQRDTGRIGKILTTIFGILAAVCFIAVFLTACFAQDALESSGNEWVMIAMFGGTFLFAGLAIFSAGVLIGAVFGSVGGIIVAAALIWGLGSADVRDVLMYRVIPVLGTGLFVVAGASLLIIPRRIAARMSAVYTQPISAVVVKKTMRTRRDSKGRSRRSYFLTWEYKGDGKRYRYVSNTGRSPERRDAGHVGELYIKPGEYDTVWEKPELLDKIVLTIIGAAFAGLGLFAFIATLIGIFTAS